MDRKNKILRNNEKKLLDSILLLDIESIKKMVKLPLCIHRDNDYLSELYYFLKNKLKNLKNNTDQQHYDTVRQAYEIFFEAADTKRSKDQAKDLTDIIKSVNKKSPKMKAQATKKRKF